MVCLPSSERETCNRKYCCPHLCDRPGALAAGVLTQSLARHLRIPGIVLLLGVGVLLDPDVAGIILPETLGSVLHVIVGLAVAVILFEGGMSLNISRLRRQSRPIRMLVTAGVIITAAGGALASRLFLGWGWQMSILFGTLVVVTGPTVIQPLLRRIKVKKNVHICRKWNRCGYHGGTDGWEC